MFATQKQRRVGELLLWITTASLAKNLRLSKDTAEWIILGIITVTIKIASSKLFLPCPCAMLRKYFFELKYHSKI